MKIKYKGEVIELKPDYDIFDEIVYNDKHCWYYYYPNGEQLWINKDYESELIPQYKYEIIEE